MSRSPDLDLYTAESKLDLINQALAEALGGDPDWLHFSDPAQLSVVVDLRPFMRILGGPWLAVLERADEKRTAMDGRVGTGIGHEEDEEFMKVKKGPHRA
jgi:hypothetical protein